jgi:drug/metabolite transporter (DMT)-like permease
MLSAPKGGSELVASGGGGFDMGLLVVFAGWYLGNYYYTLNNKLALKAAGGTTGFPLTIGFLQMCIGSLYALFAWAAPDMRTLPTVTVSDLSAILPVAACAAGAHVSSIFSMNLGAVSFAQVHRLQPRTASSLAAASVFRTVGVPQRAVPHRAAPSRACLSFLPLPHRERCLVRMPSPSSCCARAALPLTQIVKAAEPAFAALLGVTLYGKSVSQAKWLCLVPVIGGICIASLEEVGCAH